MDTKALRQRILDLAIHGKLVPQDPNDEPAAVLLQRIREEKERLVKEGKIKKGKKDKKASETEPCEDVPFEVPSSWEWTTLGELFTLQAGKNIEAANIKDKQTTKYKYSCFGGNGIRGYVSDSNHKGDCTIIGRQGALCGNVNIARGEFYATEHAVVVERYDNTDLMWAYYTLVSLNLNQYATATAQPGLAVNIINEVYIPLPPYAEQVRISEKIESLFSQLDLIETGKSNLQSAVKQAKSKILDLAIHGKLVPQDPNDEQAAVLLLRIREEKERLVKEGKIKKEKKNARVSETEPCEDVPFEVPSSWEWTTLGELFTLQAGKNIEAANIKDKQTTKYKYSCFGGNGIRGYVSDSNHKGDCTIIGRQGALCGNVNIARGEFYATEHAVVVERYDNTDLMWAYYTLVSLNLNQYATATAQPGLAVNIINEVYIPLPPYAEQVRISEKIESLFSQLDLIEASL